MWALGIQPLIYLLYSVRPSSLPVAIASRKGGFRLLVSKYPGHGLPCVTRAPLRRASPTAVR
eukprot:7299552-Heterocapsa_arctica.AAC.1